MFTEIARQIPREVLHYTPSILKSFPAVLLADGFDVDELAPTSRQNEFTKRHHTDVLINQKVMMPCAALLLLPHAAPVDLVSL